MPDNDALPDTDALMALPDHAARIAYVEGLSAEPGSDYATAVKRGAVLAVLTALAAEGRTDPAVVRGFLDAALSDDGSLRDAAVGQAQRGELPPARMAAPSSPRRPPRLPLRRSIGCGATRSSGCTRTRSR